ncbi:MAG: hypothetical protein AABP62_11620 [Planctomycetota bacterium]
MAQRKPRQTAHPPRTRTVAVQPRANPKRDLLAMQAELRLTAARCALDQLGSAAGGGGGGGAAARSVSELIRQGMEAVGTLLDVLIHAMLCGRAEQELETLTNFIRDNRNTLPPDMVKRLEQSAANLLNAYSGSC